MGIKVKAGSRQLRISSGEYRATVNDIREGSFVGKRKTFEFFFEIADGEHRGVVLRGFVNGHYESFSEYTKLRQWVNAINKGDIDVGDDLDLDSLFKGKVLRVRVEDKVSRKTKNVFSNVVEVLGVYLDQGI